MPLAPPTAVCRQAAHLGDGGPQVGPVAQEDGGRGGDGVVHAVVRGGVGGDDVEPSAHKVLDHPQEPGGAQAHLMSETALPEHGVQVLRYYFKHQEWQHHS